jgi:hypothetical protein
MITVYNDRAKYCSLSQRYWRLEDTVYVVHIKLDDNNLCSYGTFGKMMDKSHFWTPSKVSRRYCASICISQVVYPTEFAADKNAIIRYTYFKTYVSTDATTLTLCSYVCDVPCNQKTLYLRLYMWSSMAQSSEKAPFTSEFVGLILAMDSCEKSQSSLCRKSWLFSGCSVFFPQGKLTGWIRINTVKKVISQLLWR